MIRMSPRCGSCLREFGCWPNYVPYAAAMAGFVAAAAWGYMTIETMYVVQFKLESNAAEVRAFLAMIAFIHGLVASIVAYYAARLALYICHNMRDILGVARTIWRNAWPDMRRHLFGGDRSGRLCDECAECSGRVGILPAARNTGETDP